MSWSKVKLIFLREMRDQLRDRRTLFMIVVLPMLLYPLMGMTFFQVSQFMQEHPTKITVVGGSALPADPPFLVDDQISVELFSSPDRARLLEVEQLPVNLSADEVTSWAQVRLDEGQCDAVVYFPPEFAQQLLNYSSSDNATRSTHVPRPRVFFTGAKDRSRVAYERLTVVLDRWRAMVVRHTLSSHQIPVTAATPFETWDEDVAASSGRRAAMWSKVLPFALILWALTGAFYPAIDLCAGEKERGTLETLLCSPAERVEIVWGKLLTVMVFSVATSLLNLLSLSVTGAAVLSRMNTGPGGLALMGPPPLVVMVWMVLALLPLAAIFSALSLALATMARSTKEGQYYLMPLMLITLPLSMIAIIPTTEIGFGNSIIPVTGVMLLLRTVIEGDYLLALRYLVPTSIVTAICCLLTIRWAVDLFSNEAVLFRENERFSVGAWLRSLVRDRGVTPSAAEGFMCAILLLMLQFFARVFAPMPTSWAMFATQTLIVQMALVAAPVLLLAVMLTASPRRSLLLVTTPWRNVAMAVLLAFLAHPVASALSELLQKMYPINPEALAVLAEVSKLLEGVPLWQVVLLMAVVPAICEELAFRGFVLSGLRHLGHKGMAILISSLFFGIVHAFLQQSINAFILGMLLGYIAVQTGSLLPGVVFHAIHNSLAIAINGVVTVDTLEQYPLLKLVFAPSVRAPEMLTFQWPIVAVSAVLVTAVIDWFRSWPFWPSPEERLQAAIHVRCGSTP